MNILLELVLITAAGVGLFSFTRWVERSTRRSGLADLILACLLLSIAFVGLAAGRRLLPLLFAVIAIRSFYFWRRAAHAQLPADGA